MPLPLERSDAILDLSDPNIVLGPCKHHPTERLLENGDPLACKKARTDMSTAMADLAVSRSSSISRSVHTTPMPSSSPLTCSTDPAQSSDDQSSDGAQVIMVDDNSDEEGSDDSNEGEVTEEDDEAELGT